MLGVEVGGFAAKPKHGLKNTRGRAVVPLLLPFLSQSHESPRAIHELPRAGRKRRSAERAHVVHAAVPLVGRNAGTAEPVAAFERQWVLGR